MTRAVQPRAPAARHVPVGWGTRVLKISTETESKAPGDPGGGLGGGYSSRTAVPLALTMSIPPPLPTLIVS